jgi:hypothetical protein
MVCPPVSAEALQRREAAQGRAAARGIVCARRFLSESPRMVGSAGGVAPRAHILSHAAVFRAHGRRGAAKIWPAQTPRFLPGGARFHRGGAPILRNASVILSRPHHALWLTPQGRFTDIRERPVRFEPGLGHLAARLPGVKFIPLALEFVWWHERSRKCSRLWPRRGAARRAACRRTPYTTRRRARQLSGSTRRRQPAAGAAQFRTLLNGRAGVGGIYDLWRRMRARGQEFDVRHDDAPQ